MVGWPRLREALELGSLSHGMAFLAAVGSSGHAHSEPLITTAHFRLAAMSSSRYQFASLRETILQPLSGLLSWLELSSLPLHNSFSLPHNSAK